VLLVDPTAEEETEATAHVTVAYTAEPHVAHVGEPAEDEDMSEVVKVEDKLFLSATKGVWPVQMLLSALRHGEVTCANTADVLRE
jgi:exosome complex RNA-binding protein Rrp42 (RNase PH superfamily)